MATNRMACGVMIDACLPPTVAVCALSTVAEWTDRRWDMLVRVG